jgi:ABC-type metal ion transport system substrate-binding protein
LKLTRDELYAFLNGGELPISLAGVLDNTAEPETIYSRRNKKPTDLPDGEDINFGSEAVNDEEY